MAPAKPFLLMLPLLLTVGWSGCLDAGDGAGTSSTDAPDGPRSLRVGSTTIGENLRIAINRTGHTIDYEFSGNDIETKVVPVNDHDYLERTVQNASGSDAHLRPFEGVAYAYRYTDMDPEEDQPGGSAGTSLYERATQRLVFEDVHAVFTTYSVSCTSGACQSSKSTMELDFRTYNRDRDQIAERYSLAGKVLTLGKTISFNDTWTDRDGNVHVTYANFTARREAKLEGERVFIVEPKYSTVVHYKVRPPEETSSPDPSSTTSAAPKPPKATNLLYMSSRAPVPVQAISNYPFEHEGTWYWSNTTSTLESYEPGGSPVPWLTGTPLPTITQKPGTTPVAPLDLLKDTETPLTMGANTAWNAVKSDPTLTGFQDRLKANPNLLPTRSLYYPDPGRNVYTWGFLAGAENESKIQVEARLNGVGPQRTAYVPQQRESGGGYRSTVPLAGDLVQNLKLMKIKDAYDTFRAVHPEGAEPALLMELQRNPSDGYAPQARATFAYPQSFAPGSGGISLNIRQTEVLFSRESVSVDLADGGLLGFNNTGFFVIHQYPWTPNTFPLAGEPVPSHDSAYLSDFARRWG